MTESIKRIEQEFTCDFCGHLSGDHSQRMSDSEQAPCFKCGCEDFQSEAADNARSDEAVRQAWDVTPRGWGGPDGLTTSRVFLDELWQMLNAPGQDLTGYVPTLIQRIEALEVENARLRASLKAEIDRNSPLEALLRGQRDLQRARAEKAEARAIDNHNRADANFKSYERVKAHYSELVTAARFALLYHDEPCRPDHHGYCQTHNLEPVHLCWVPALRRALGLDGAGVRLTENATSHKGNRAHSGSEVTPAE